MMAAAAMAMMPQPNKGKIVSTYGEVNITTKKKVDVTVANKKTSTIGVTRPQRGVRR